MSCLVASTCCTMHWQVCTLMESPKDILRTTSALSVSQVTAVACFLSHVVVRPSSLPSGKVEQHAMCQIDSPCWANRKGGTTSEAHGEWGKVTSHSISLAVVVHTWHTGESTSQKEALQWQSLTLVIAIIGHICACMYLHIRTHEHTPQTLLLFPACFQLPLHSSPLSFEAIVTLPLCLNCISPVSPLIVTLATYAQTTQHSLCLADNKDLCQWKTTVTA